MPKTSKLWRTACTWKYDTEGEFFDAWRKLFQHDLARRKAHRLEYARAYRLKNKAKVDNYRREWQRAWHANNREKSRSKSKAAYHKHAERRRISARDYRRRMAANPEALERYRKWARERAALRAKTDLEFLIRKRLRTRILESLRRGVSKASSTVSLLGCSIPEFKLYIESLWLPGMSWENYGRSGWHLDHKVPCKRFDLTKPEEQFKCFHFTNIQPLWAFDNLSKGGLVHA